jgi:Mg/Co/Ni transporter MgtE
MGEPRGNNDALVKQWVIDSYLSNSTFIGYAEHVHPIFDAPYQVPSVDKLANLNLQRAAELLRRCLKRPEHVRTAIDHLALVPSKRAIQLLCQVDQPDDGLWGAVLLCMGRQRCRPFVDAMTREQQTRTARSAIVHIRHRCDSGGAADAAAALLDTDRRVAATLLAAMPLKYRVQILAASRAQERVSLLNDMLPQSVYQLVVLAVDQSAPIIYGWLGAMRPDRIAAALMSTKPQQHVARIAVRSLHRVQGSAATAELLARLPGTWADALFGAIGPMAAAEVLEHGRKHERLWVRLLGPHLLARIALAVDAAKAAYLLNNAYPIQIASMLPKLPPYVAVLILANLKRSAVADCLGALAPTQAARLLGLSAWRMRVNVVFGTVHMKRSHEVRIALGPVVRADLLSQAPPDVIGRVLANMSSATAGSLLAHIPVNLARQIIALALDQAPNWLCATPPSTAIKILSALDAGRGATVLATMPSGRAVRLLAMTRAETLQFEADRLRHTLACMAAATRARRGPKLLQALGQALRHAWRLLAALWIAEAEPMAVLMRPTAVNLLQNMDPKVRERLRTDMSDRAWRLLVAPENG